jgi:molecular chaperone DnaJ
MGAGTSGGRGNRRSSTANFRFDDGFGGSAARASAPRRGPDSEATINVSLEEAFNGATRSLQLSVPETCQTCRGQGVRATGTSRTCPNCNGSGQQRRGFMGTSGVCDMCGGTGQTDLESCSACRGEGTIERPRRVEVKIPAGVAEGQKIRLAGQGVGGPGGNGDLFLVVHIEPHGTFERKGDDLYVDVPIPYYDAALGGEVRVPTLKGTRLTMRIPAGTQSGQSFRLGGQGMPNVRGGAAGDLYARARITVPKTLSARETELLTELARLAKGEPATAAAAAA